jgi:hypothetical protein
MQTGVPAQATASWPDKVEFHVWIYACYKTRMVICPDLCHNGYRAFESAARTVL